MTPSSSIRFEPTFVCFWTAHARGKPRLAWQRRAPPPPSLLHPVQGVGWETLKEDDTWSYAIRYHNELHGAACFGERML